MNYLGEYNGVGWENEPSQKTPINAKNLGIMEDAIKRIFNYLIAGGAPVVPDNPENPDSSGKDGREIELRNNGTFIQWRYVDDENWSDLVSLEELKGDEGAGIKSIKYIGSNGLVDTYAITLTNGMETTFLVTNGKNGTDANVTDENIKAALGYTPADAEKVNELSGQIPHNTSELTNDSDFQTGEQVRAEIGKMTHYKFEKAESLEDVTEENVIYLIPNEESKEDNIFDEYLLVDGVPELIGSTAIDLSGYALKEEIPTVPEKLPNPNSLTFTGAVTGSYDGREPVSIEIPNGGGSSEVELSSGWRKIIEYTATAEDAELQTFEITSADYPDIENAKAILLCVAHYTDVDSNYKRLWINDVEVSRIQSDKKGQVFSAYIMDNGICIGFSKESTVGGSVGLQDCAGFYFASQEQLPQNIITPPVKKIRYDSWTKGILYEGSIIRIYIA